MQLEVTLELGVKIEECQRNINGIIKAVCMSQNQFSRILLQEIVEAIDRKACKALIADNTERYRNKGYSKRDFRTP